LAVSAAKGDVKEIDRLIDQGVDPNAAGKHLDTPLSWAMGAGSKKGFRRLLDRGAKFDFTATDQDALAADCPPDCCLTFNAAGAAEDSEWLEILLI
jgi:ankyrin repeat protein